jgi:transposase
MTALCERYGISRDTGYRLLGRYRAEGPSGLEPRSRAPRRHGMAMAEEVAAAIVALRRQRPYWGPKKLRAVLQTVVASAVDDWRSAAARGAQRATPPAAASGAA